MSKELGITTATAHHLLNTLADDELIHRARRGGYELGAMIGVLGHAYQQRHTPPHKLSSVLRRLGEQTGESAYLVGWRHRDIAILDIVEGSHAVRVGELALGPSRDAHARASGKTLLAFAPEALCHNYIARHPLFAVTPQTITDPDAFEQELAKIREAGYGTDEREFKESVSCVAAPVRTEGTVLHCYAISVPLERFVGNRESLIEAVLESAEEAST